MAQPEHGLQGPAAKVALLHCLRRRAYNMYVGCCTPAQRPGGRALLTWQQAGARGGPPCSREAQRQH